VWKVARAIWVIVEKIACRTNHSALGRASTRCAVSVTNKTVFCIRIKESSINASLTSANVVVSLAEGRAAYTTIVVRGEFVSDRTTIAGYGINTIRTILRTQRAGVDSAIKIEERVTSCGSVFIRASNTVCRADNLRRAKTVSYKSEIWLQVVHVMASEQATQFWGQALQAADGESKKKFTLRSRHVKFKRACKCSSWVCSHQRILCTFQVWNRQRKRLDMLDKTNLRPRRIQFDM